MPRLTEKQRRFAEAYVQCRDAAEAARRAGYRGSDAQLLQRGSTNLAKREILVLIAQLGDAPVPASEEPAPSWLARKVRKLVGRARAVLEWMRRSFQDVAVRRVELILSVSPLAMALAAFLYSALLILLSDVADVWTYRVGGQSKGYAQTLNWAWGFTLLAPGAYFFLLRTFDAVGKLPNQLAQRGMLLDAELKPHEQGSAIIGGKWTTIRKQYAPWWLALTLLGVVVTGGEWAKTSGLPLLTGIEPAESEWDWSVKFYGGTWAERIRNSIFSLLVFSQQAWMCMMVALLIYLVLCLAALFADLRAERRAVRLFPSRDLNDSDERCGYQVFADTYSSFLIACVFLYAQFFLSRVWNVFLHPDVDPPPSTARALIAEPLRDGFAFASALVKGEGGLAGVLDALTDYVDSLGTLNFSGLAVTLGAFLVYTLSLVILVYTMRKTAQEGRDELLRVTSKRVRERLENMAIWPLRYPGLASLAALGFLGLVCIVAYKYGIFFLAAAIAAGCAQGARELLKLRRE